MMRVVLVVVMPICDGGEDGDGEGDDVFTKVFYCFFFVRVLIFPLFLYSFFPLILFFFLPFLLSFSFFALFHSFCMYFLLLRFSFPSLASSFL